MIVYQCILKELRARFSYQCIPKDLERFAWIEHQGKASRVAKNSWRALRTILPQPSSVRKDSSRKARSGVDPFRQRRNLRSAALPSPSAWGGPGAARTRGCGEEASTWVRRGDPAALP